MLDDSHVCGPGCKMMGFIEISLSNDWSREGEIMRSQNRHLTSAHAEKPRRLVELESSCA
jgi:hypothetical protein